MTPAARGCQRMTSTSRFGTKIATSNCKRSSSRRKKRGPLYKDRAQVIRPAKFFKHDPVKRWQESSTVGRREAVSGRFSHKERRTPRTSSVSIWFTWRLRMVAAYSTRVIFHCRRCFSLRHSVDLPSVTSRPVAQTSEHPWKPLFWPCEGQWDLPHCAARRARRDQGGDGCGGPMAIEPHRHWLKRVLSRRWRRS
jgi:hypothetical protein